MTKHHLIVTITAIFVAGYCLGVAVTLAYLTPDYPASTPVIQDCP